MNLGKCTNFGNCDIADKKEPVRLLDTGGSVCPECGRPLTLVEDPNRSSLTSRRTLVVAGGALVALLGVGYCATTHPFRGHSAGIFGIGGGEVLLTFSGSNMVSERLGPALAKAFLEGKGYTGVEIGEARGDESDVTGSKDGKTVRIHFNNRGSDAAFKDLGAGTADIGMASRQITPEEVQSLSALGPMNSPAGEHVIALNGVAAIVSPSNPVTQLSLDQLADIFSGRISNWSQVGGPAGPMHLFSRSAPSGTLDFFKVSVLKGGDVTPNAKFIVNSTELSNTVAADPLAIGFVGLPYILGSRAVAISAAGKEGVRYVVPNYLTVKSEIYPIVARLYLYTPANPTNRLVGEFVRFAASPEGQAIAAAKQYVRYDVEKPVEGLGTVAAPQNAPAEYKDLTRDADLLQIMYFNTGSRTPQSLATAIMDSLPNKLDELHLKPEQLMLFGFTDNVGSASSNLGLSRDRVSLIARALEARGIKVGKGEGFGGTNFLRSNLNEEGRQYNRRIEIWARKSG